MKITIGIVIGLAAVVGANHLYNKQASSPETEEMEEAGKVKPVGPAFDADSAYAFVKSECDFGPRAMNTEAHDR